MRVAELVVHGPLSERDLHDDLRCHPVRAQARQPLRLREWRLVDFQAIEPGAKIEQQLGVEAGADFPCKDEVVAFEVSNEQRTETDSRALRIGEAADDELLARLALHLQPVRRSTMLVERVAPFGDDAFPALCAGALPRLVIVERRDAPERG